MYRICYIALTKEWKENRTAICVQRLELLGMFTVEKNKANIYFFKFKRLKQQDRCTYRLFEQQEIIFCTHSVYL